MPVVNSSKNSAKNRPLIGITERLNTEDTFYLRRYYSEAVEAAGGIPIHIPLIPKLEYPAELCDRIHVERLCSGQGLFILSNRCPTSCQPKVFTHVFAPEAQRRLAGDEGFAESPEQCEI